jgi:hypothetical protein
MGVHQQQFFLRPHTHDEAKIFMEPKNYLVAAARRDQRRARRRGHDTNETFIYRGFL